MKKTAFFLVFAMLISLFSASVVTNAAEEDFVPHYGDVNQDGEIDSADGTMLSRVMAKWAAPENYNQEAANLNFDEEVDSADATLLARYLAKWDVSQSSRIGQEMVAPVALTLQGRPITDYTIVIPDITISRFDDKTETGNITVPLEKYKGVDLPKILAVNAAKYINDEIERLTGTRLNQITDAVEDTGLEIVIGQTNREISSQIDVSDLGGMKFEIAANEEDVTVNGKDFLVAGAAYYFVNTLIAGKEDAAIEIPADGLIAEPTPEAPKNFIYFIGDGMGQNHPKLLGSNTTLVNNETLPLYNSFAGYLLPNQGLSRTRSANNDVTDSAAGGTALATGYKTNNGYVGMAPDGETQLKNLAELAHELGLATAVLSTDAATGATPAAYSAHVISRTLADDITAQQKEKTDSGELDLLRCGFKDGTFISTIDTTLNRLKKSETGFFMMYEEAHTDKESHNSSLTNTYWAMVRGNMAIIKFMEFAMYNPDTVLVITADHETGGLTDAGYDRFKFTSNGKHTGADVPVIGYGVGTEMFNGVRVDNTAIAKFFARSLGYNEPFGDQDIPAGALTE